MEQDNDEKLTRDSIEWKYKVIVVGIGGPIAQQTTGLLLKRKNLQLVGAVDLRDDLVGKDVGILLGVGSLGVCIEKNLREVASRTAADVALVMTSSKIDLVYESLADLLEAGVSVVSSCEELFYVDLIKNPKVKKLDQLAKLHKSAFLSTGVNPGFLMDFLPLILSSVMDKIESVSVERFQNASTRRKPFQNKIGVGLSEEQFLQRREDPAFGHAGLQASLQFLSHKLSISYDRIEETISPVLKDGVVQGVYQTVNAYLGEENVIELYFKATICEEDPRDRIFLRGNPPSLEATIRPALHGDIATCAILLNAIPSVFHASPGYRTMADVMPFFSWNN